MRNAAIWLVVGVLCSVASAEPIDPAPDPLAPVSAELPEASQALVRAPEPAAERDWVVDRVDNVCGLDDPRMLSYPARVEYDVLLALTPAMKRVREEGIDPNSSQGIQLREQAVDAVRKACDKVRRASAHCSVWKRISHRDGREVPDITEKVKGEL